MLATMSQSPRHYRLLPILATVLSLVFLGSISFFRPLPRPGLSSLRSFIGTTSTGQRPVIEIEGLTLGERFTKTGDVKSDENLIPWLMESLKSRFAATLGRTDVNASYPSCTLQPERYAKTALDPEQSRFHWSRRKRQSVVSFAINLKDSEAIIPAQSLALLEAIALLLQNNRVYVSIYENGSTDKTQLLLADLGAALQAVGVDGLWMHSSRMLSDFSKHDRIVMLSEIRNLALAPLIPYASDGGGGASNLLLMNDVLTCTSDLLELIHQQRLQHASMVMGMDWGTVKRKIRSGEPGYLHQEHPNYNEQDPPYTNVTRLYDMWVARGINGDLIYPFATPGGYTPVSDNETWVIDAFSTQEEGFRQRWLDGRPLPVYSGWGGMAAFDASLFTHDHLRFRSTRLSGWTGGSSTGALGPWGVLISREGYLESDCPGASECEYIARDIWNLREGRARIVMAPQVRTTYNLEDWIVMDSMAPVTRGEGPDVEGLDVIDWTWVGVPGSVVCIASRSREGAVLDIWSESNHRTRIDPLWSPGGGLGVVEEEEPG